MELEEDEAKDMEMAEEMETTKDLEMTQGMEMEDEMEMELTMKMEEEEVDVVKLPELMLPMLSLLLEATKSKELLSLLQLIILQHSKSTICIYSSTCCSRG